MKKLLLSITTVLSLFSCGTLITHIENIDNYTQFEITVPDNSLIASGKSGVRIQTEIFDRNFQNKRLIMDEYYIVETDNISIFTNVPPKGQSGTYNSFVGGRYEFFKGETNLYKFEIVTDSFITVFSNSTSINSTSIGDWRKFIRIIDNENTIQTEIEPNMPNVDIYFSVFDEEIGNLVIRQYRSRSANHSPNSRWQYQTGFIIEIDGEEYGILAFYPYLRLYKNNGFDKTINEKMEDKIILYIFMAYEGFNREDDVFIRQ